ncbi:MAG: alanine racemase [Lachnospiraceae bacterium]|nr:alanine racemase [Lachnospiraceae bacterium]
MNKQELTYAAEKWGTPLYLFDIRELEKTVEGFRAALGSGVGLCFAVKANPFVLPEMAQLTDRIEVCSMGEYRICRKCGIEPEKLLISGVLKKEADLREIFRECGGRCCYTAESKRQYELLAKLSREAAETVRVFPRLSNGSQFGMDRREIEEILTDAGERQNLKIQGLHYFTGTQKKKIDKIEKELAMLDQLLLEWKEAHGFVPEELEYGPGLWVDYFGNGKEDPQIQREQLGELVAGMCFDGTVVLEMGRALAAYCGSYLTSVLDMKSTGDRHYAIVDGGLHQLSYDGQIRGMYVPKMQVLRRGQDALGHEARDAQTQQEWTVCGSLCTTNDVLVQQMKTPELAVGDVLVFEQTGAYSVMEGMAVFLSHELPAVVSCNTAGEWHLLREQVETYLFNTPAW